MDKAQVYAEYTVDEYGTIKSPGKFESESWIAPIVYNWYLDGDAGEMVEDVSFYVLDDDTRAELELEADDYAIASWESEQGFVHVWTLHEAEYLGALAVATEGEE